MIFAMTFLVFVHVVISLVGLATGFVVLFGLLTARRLDGWTSLFLASTVATSLSGFVIPADQFLPSHAIGILSMIVLAVAIYARYARRLDGAWRWLYVVSAMAAFYFNMFVFVVQAFLKVPALAALAPTQTELPFAVAQGGVLVAFVVAGFAATRRFRRELILPERVTVS